MDILQQCQKWNENDEYEKIIDALETIPAKERTPEEDSELARAYNNLADPTEPEGRDLLKKAIALLKPHEEYFAGDHCWNFRMGYAYYYLDQEGRALRYFGKALKARPDDADTKELIDLCKKGISLPQFSECFRERTESAWETFARQEAEFRRMMDEDKEHTRGQELVDQMEEILNQVFDEISFEMGVGGEKYELILTPEGDKVKLFELVYFQKRAPKEVLQHWNILVGRQPDQNIGLRTNDGWEISGEDVQVWLEEQDENRFAVSVYCEKLLPMLREKEGKVWWMLTTLTDQVLGEIPHMRYIDSFDVLEKPKAEPSFLLSKLPDKLKEQGADLSTDPEAYLESYLGYEMKPNEDPDADWRLDTIAGSTCCVALINGYLTADNDFMDELHADGAAAGFFCYPLDTLREEKGSQKIFDFRDKLEKALAAWDGPEALALTGGATGLFCGYVDFIAWDIRAALNMAKAFFEETDIPWASFHTFRREAGTVALKNPPEGEPDDEEQTTGLDETLTCKDDIPYTRPWAELDPEDENAPAVIRECREEIANRGEAGAADEDSEENGPKGTFAGSVLLSEAEWDKEQFIRDLREEWGIVDEETDEGGDEDGNSGDAVVMRFGGMMLIAALFYGHIPDNEAEINAENNYMWPEAVEAAKAHKAHIVVAVLGGEEKLLERGRLFTKAMAVCCRQKYATGVFTSGVVFEPRFYEGFADMMKEDELPIFNWIWFGLYRSGGGLNGYTYGMDVFGKEEMEVLNADAGPEELRDFLAGMASYVLACDVTLKDGETIGFSADDKHAITRSPGVSLPEEQMTLKIAYEPAGEDSEDDEESIDMDDAFWHIESIEEKELPIDPINACNHMAIYLRWCMEHDLMGEEFLAEYGDVAEKVRTEPADVDLREFIRDELDGQLLSLMFNKTGRAFAAYYYGENDAPYYPGDIDNYALEYFGPERYHSDEFRDEAYLFIPFDEDYYQAVAEVIEKRFKNWQGQDFDGETLEPSEVAQVLMEYLDCECTYFPSMKDDDPIMSAYSYARRLGVREGFVPVLIKPDETLLECLVMNADPEHDADCYEFDLKTVAEYRKKMLAAPVKDGKAVLEELTGQRKEEARDDDLDWEEEVLGEIEGGYENRRFSSYWDSDTDMTYPLILAKIPVKNPWEIFAWLPFGNWNECPDTPDLMAAAKYWFRQYGAIPAVMSHDELEFLLPAPVPGEKAMEAAVEQYGFCPDVVDQGPEDATVGALADALRQSTVWYFWWD